MQDDIYALIEGHWRGLDMLRRFVERNALSKRQIEQSRLSIARSRALLIRPIVKLRDIERRPPPSQPNYL